MIVQKRRALAVDLFIGLGLPILNMFVRHPPPLYQSALLARCSNPQRVLFFSGIIVQGHRFNIFEDVGYYPARSSIPLTYLLITLWPVFVGIAPLIFTITNLAYVRTHHRALDPWMECTPSSLLTSSLFVCLVVLDFITFDLSSVVAIRNLVSQATAGVVAWPGYEVVHTDFGMVDQILRGLGLYAEIFLGSELNFGGGFPSGAPWPRYWFLEPRGKPERGIGLSER